MNLDTLLDDALASYSRHEPRAGLEARVMARVHAEGRPARRGWMLFALAAVALAGIAITIATRPREHRPQSAVIASAPPAPQVQPQPLPPRAQHLRKPRREPRRESFPSPVPLTPEERALVAFLQQSPEAVRQLARPAGPITIEAIDIRPLHIDGLPTGESQ